MSEPTIPTNSPPVVTVSGFLLKEAKRLIPMLLIAAMILVPDTGSFVVLYSLGITIVISAVSHIIRKILFPYIDLKSFASKALETSTGAGMVFFSISLILSVIIGSTCALLK